MERITAFQTGTLFFLLFKKPRKEPVSHFFSHISREEKNELHEEKTELMKGKSMASYNISGREPFGPHEGGAF